MNKYIERLAKEWETHGKIVIGVDFDSTIFPYHTIDNQDDIHQAIAAISRAQMIGCYVVIHTCSDPSRRDSIIEYCNELGIKVDSINENPIELPYGNHGKPYCNIFLDDRAGLNEAILILMAASNIQAGKKNTEATLSQQF